MGTNIVVFFIGEATLEVEASMTMDNTRSGLDFLPEAMLSQETRSTSTAPHTTSTPAPPPEIAVPSTSTANRPTRKATDTDRSAQLPPKRKKTTSCTFTQYVQNEKSVLSEEWLQSEIKKNTSQVELNNSEVELNKLRKEKMAAEISQINSQTEINQLLKEKLALQIAQLRASQTGVSFWGAEI